jgi:hypothetical protein
LPISPPFGCHTGEKPLTKTSLLNKKLQTFLFYSKNIFLSQANSYFSILKTSLYKEQYSEYAPLFAKIFTAYLVIKYRKHIKNNLLAIFCKDISFLHTV